MGVYIGLELIPEAVSRTAWEDAYRETLLLINAFPFVRLKSESIEGREVLTYVREPECHRDEPGKRHWHICGDIVSKKTGEGFILYYDFARYRPGPSGWERRKGRPSAGVAGDILVEIANEENTISIFNGNTRGHPYHIYVLAIAMLLETRFAPHAAVTGDITCRQAESAKEWADALLEKPVDIPVRVDKERLYQRLSNYFRGVDLFSVFFRLCLGRPEGFGVFLLAKNPHIYREWLMRALKGYSSPRVLGAIDLMIDWLNCTGDLAELCRMACLEEKGPLYDPLEFAPALCGTWLPISPEKYGFMNIFSRPAELPETARRQFGNILLDIGFKGRKINCYREKSEVISVFKKLFPEQIDSLGKAVNDSIEIIEARLAAFSEQIGPVYSTIHAPDGERSQFMDDCDLLLYYDNNIKITERQKKNLELLAYKGKLMLSLFQHDREPIEALNLGNLQLLAGAVSQLGLALTEDAWEWIRKETNEDVIRLLVVFSAFELVFKTCDNVLRALLENRTLCNKILRLMEDPEAMAGVRADLNNKQSGDGPELS
ncbi:hypothetical protein DCCM_4469 [Desulfocucumis palustris]|uniref:Uncharacterized protein n=1 Tax=Desulfocucumis palustris TaxID=1898651 RepID=A0A2L2XM08_9FIRM|nr:hypothetical protein [Desulfocucumis palustris]GBF35346.1 hypothetical protein DCCM_4469 [Desulfocucumis palustris]